MAPSQRCASLGPRRIRFPGRAALRNFAAFRADFASRQSAATPANGFDGTAEALQSLFDIAMKGSVQNLSHFGLA